MTTTDYFLGVMLGVIFILGSILCSFLYFMNRFEIILHRLSQTERKMDSFKELYRDNQVNLDCFFNECGGTDDEKGH